MTVNTLCETLPYMTTINNRQLAGSIVRDEIARQGLDQEEAAARAHISRSTLHKVFNGDEKVQPLTLRQIEGALDLPRHLLTLIIEGNAEKIAAIEQMDPDLRRHVLGSLAESGKAVGGTRKAQRRA